MYIYWFSSESGYRRRWRRRRQRRTSQYNISPIKDFFVIDRVQCYTNLLLVFDFNSNKAIVDSRLSPGPGATFDELDQTLHWRPYGKLLLNTSRHAATA